MKTIVGGVKIDDKVELHLGDYASFGEDVIITGKGRLKIGDYTKIHRGTLIVCHSDVTIGHNCWIGERSVIDGTAELTLGNNVGIGVGSSIFTHISFGDTFAGCKLRNSKSIKIEDEVWLVGQVMIQASNIAKRTVIMPMSNVTADINTPNTVWAGNPAIDQTFRYGIPWNETSIEFRLRRFKTLVENYAKESGQDVSWIQCVDRLPSKSEQSTATYFSMRDRTYTKRKTERECMFMRWLLKHNKAKFLPENSE